MLSRLLYLQDCKDELEALMDELETVERMEEADVCEQFNADSKDEYLEVLMDEICSMKATIDSLAPIDYEGLREEEEERKAICESQGLSRYC